LPSISFNCPAIKRIPTFPKGCKNIDFESEMGYED
jgi:hypothetical protein